MNHKGVKTLLIRRIIGVFGVAAPLLGGCNSSGSPSAQQAYEENSRIFAVKYRAVSSDGRKISVTYADGFGGFDTETVKSPWLQNVGVKRGKPLHLAAHSLGAGTITLSIELDGKIVKHAESQTPSKEVACDYDMPFVN